MLYSAPVVSQRQQLSRRGEDNSSKGSGLLLFPTTVSTSEEKANSLDRASQAAKNKASFREGLGLARMSMQNDSHTLVKQTTDQSMKSESMPRRGTIISNGGVINTSKQNA